MIDATGENSYNKLSTKENDMSDLSMSMFATKEDLLRARADLSRQDQERVRVVAAPGLVSVTRLVAGVELALKQSGSRWVLSAKKQK